MAYSRKKPAKRIRLPGVPLREDNVPDTKQSKAFRKIKAGLSEVLETVKRPPEEHGETCLQMHCRQWLGKSGLWDRLLIFHVPNQRMGGVGAGIYFQRMGVRAGVADWLVFIPGRSVAIELKDKEGEQRKTQEKFQAKWEQCGNVYFVARTLEEFQGIVNGVALFA